MLSTFSWNRSIVFQGADAESQCAQAASSVQQQFARPEFSENELTLVEATCWVTRGLTATLGIHYEHAYGESLQTLEIAFAQAAGCEAALPEIVARAAAAKLPLAYAYCQGSKARLLYAELMGRKPRSATNAQAFASMETCREESARMAKVLENRGGETLWHGCRRGTKARSENPASYFAWIYFIQPAAIRLEAMRGQLHLSQPACLAHAQRVQKAWQANAFEVFYAACFPAPEGWEEVYMWILPATRMLDTTRTEGFPGQESCLKSLALTTSAFTQRGRLVLHSYCDERQGTWASSLHWTLPLPRF